MLLHNLIAAARGQRPFQAPAQAPVAPAPQPIPQPTAAPAPPRSSIAAPDPGNELSPDIFTNMVDRWDRRPERSRVGGNPEGYMHASSLITLACQRQTCLVAQHHVEVSDSVTGGHRIMWAQGRATETHIRDAVLGATHKQDIYGEWKCRCGHATHRGFVPNESFQCQRCLQPLDKYHEPELRDEELRVTGSPDITLQVDGRLLVGEIKSMTPDQFDGLAAPLGNHINQAALYRALYARAGFPVHDKVAIIYGRKQFKWGGKGKVYKEFHVTCTTPLVTGMVETCFQTARDVARHNSTRTLPNRTVCSGPNDKIAAKCPVAHLCFALRG